VENPPEESTAETWLREWQESWRANAEHRRRAEPEQWPLQFGMLFFGPVPGFEAGPHFVMVKQLDSEPRPQVPIAPITHTKSGGRMVLKLPAGTLPERPGATPRASYLLLGWRPTVHVDDLRGDLYRREKTRLPEDILDQAREKLLAR
jgi:hypothetical protein